MAVFRRSCRLALTPSSIFLFMTSVRDNWEVTYTSPCICVYSGAANVIFVKSRTIAFKQIRGGSVSNADLGCDMRSPVAQPILSEPSLVLQSPRFCSISSDEAVL